MTNEKIDKRIKGFRFWKNVNFWLMIIFLIVSILAPFEDWKMVFRIQTAFFLGMFWSCKWFQDLYEDMKEK